MNRILKYFAIVTLIALAFASCSRKGETSGEEEKYGVSEADSISILQSTNEIMALLQNNNIEAAAKKLYIFNPTDSTVTPSGDEEIKNMTMRSKIFPVKEFTVKETDFRDPLYNAVVYDVTFGNPDPETGNAPKTKMAFNIINLDGEIYVTTMDKSSLPKGY